MKFKAQLSNNKTYSESVSNVRFNSQTAIWNMFKDVKNIKILEIGPRLKRWFIREQLQLNNCEYYSICINDSDYNTELPKDGKIKSSGSYQLNTSRLMDYFDENYFDFIIGIQSFEHWGEVVGKDAYVDGIYQCGKILKNNGWFIQDFPICHHGEDYFMYQKWDELKKLFSSNIWGSVEISEYGKENVPNTDHVKCLHSKRNRPSELKCENCAWNGMLKVQRMNTK